MNRRGYKGVPDSVAEAIGRHIAVHHRPLEAKQLTKLRDLENPRIIARHPFADTEANR